MHVLSVVVLTTAAVLGYVDAWPSYVSSIPNGKIVPNPCGNGGTWQASAHNAPGKGTGINKFGRDFQAAGRKWTKALCKKDSDGDGRTNGDELGDPGCQWTTGAKPARTANLGNPGICEPVTSDACKRVNTFLNANNCALLSKKSTNNRKPRDAYNYGDNFQQRQATDTATSNPWILQRNCVCYCKDDSQFGGKGRGRQDFQGRGQGRNNGNHRQGNLQVNGFPQQGAQKGVFGGHHGGGFMRPPIEQTPEFNDTITYNVRHRCTCACPKSQ